MAVVKTIERRPSDVRGSLAAVTTSLDETCFVISPIGDEGTEYRKHADLVLSSLIEPALKSLGLTAVRADKISIPGNDHRPGHRPCEPREAHHRRPVLRQPQRVPRAGAAPRDPQAAVQIIGTADRLPFDVGQFRTYQIDMTDIYTLVPQLDLHRSEITRLCGAAIEEGAMAESPLSRFYPNFWDQIDQV